MPACAFVQSNDAADRRMGCCCIHDSDMDVDVHIADDKQVICMHCTCSLRTAHSIHYIRYSRYSNNDDKELHYTIWHRKATVMAIYIFSGAICKMHNLCSQCNASSVKQTYICNIHTHIYIDHIINNHMYICIMHVVSYDVTLAADDNIKSNISYW